MEALLLSCSSLLKKYKMIYHTPLEPKFNEDICTPAFRC